MPLPRPGSIRNDFNPSLVDRTVTTGTGEMTGGAPRNGSGPGIQVAPVVERAWAGNELAAPVGD